MAGLGAGLTEAVVVNPFEVVKVSLQANRDSFKEVLASQKRVFFFLLRSRPFNVFFSLSSSLLPSCALAQQPSSFGQARRIIKADGLGLRGLNKGLTSTLGRHGVFNMIYFGFYFNVKDAIPTNPVAASPSSAAAQPPPSAPPSHLAPRPRRIAASV